LIVLILADRQARRNNSANLAGAKHAAMAPNAG